MLSIFRVKRCYVDRKLKRKTETATTNELAVGSLCKNELIGSKKKTFFAAINSNKMCLVDRRARRVDEHCMRLN